MPSATQRSDELWAITCYFNPIGYKRRLMNYQTFRRNLSVPLVAAELSYRDGFELCESDAEILIQLRGRDILWQKERLLNLAFQAVPKDCDKIAWLDCDVVFRCHDWVPLACQQLDQLAVIQLFDTVYWLAGRAFPETEVLEQIQHTATSSARWLTRGDDSQPPGVGPPWRAWGCAWAARREVIQTHGFYDVCVVGGGDAAMAFAFFGRFESAVDALHMNRRQAEHYLSWAKPMFCDVRGSIGWVDGEIDHLFHGDRQNRNYRQREIGFHQFDFDPFNDIVIGDNGCWRWNTEKYAMHEYVRNYFESRKEDG